MVVYWNRSNLKRYLSEKMVYIISGKINQGKTERILKIYEEFNSGDGIISCKKLVKGVFTGYEIVRLSNRYKMPLIYKSEYIPVNWDEAFKYDIFSFSEKAINFAEQVIDEILFGKCNPIYLDEIGPVELKGMGFYRALKKVLTADRDLYITVRESCVDDVIRKFEINKYKILSHYYWY